MSVDFRLSKTIIGKSVVSSREGQIVGKVEDLFVDETVDSVMALYLGAEGLINRKHQLVPFNLVQVIGVDVVLIPSAEVVETKDEIAAAASWLRTKTLIGRKVDTVGGTPIGKLADLVLDAAGNILGFALSNISVEGPVAANKAVARQAVVDMGDQDGGITIDMQIAEAQSLSITGS